MALAPLANMTWRTFIDIFAGEFAEHPNGKKAVIWLRECIKGLNEEDRYQIGCGSRASALGAQRPSPRPKTRRLTPSPRTGSGRPRRRPLRSEASSIRASTTSATGPETSTAPIAKMPRLLD